MAITLKLTGTHVLIVSLIILGYLIILFSSIFSEKVSISSADNGNELDDMKLENNQLQAKLISLNRSHEELRIQLNQMNQKEDSSTKTIAVRPGVIILGMHRSGTSIVGGLMNKMGLNAGGPLIHAAEDNAKGFFERIDVVLQNDYLMKKQGVHYGFHMFKYDHLTAIKDILNDDGSLFREGKKGLNFLNNPQNYPWMLKDPRLCVTFRTWLPFLNFVPAILFTYRHPLDVALSLKKREFERFAISKTLKLWYVYNRRAIEQSHDLCRITTSHRLVMAQPVVELDRIFMELKACGVHVPIKLDKSEIISFLDSNLQHGRTGLEEKVCEGNLKELMPPSTWDTKDQGHLLLYREVMRVYCAMEDGSAYKTDFDWDRSIKDDE